MTVKYDARDVVITDTNNDDKGDVRSADSATDLAVGENSNANHDERRAWIPFPLSATDRTQIAEAGVIVLGLKVRQAINTSGLNVAVYGLPNRTSADAIVSDFEASGTLIASSAVPGSTLADSVYSIDVTDFVKAEAAKSSPVVCFRLQVNPNVPNAGTSQNCFFFYSVEPATVGNDHPFLKLVRDGAPQISGVSNQTTNEDVPVTMSFSVSDPAWPAGSLVLGASSSNSSVVANTGLGFGGSGSSRTLTITPVANQSGSTTISLSVENPRWRRTYTFTVTVNPVNDPPTITPFADHAVSPGTSLGPLTFTVSDVDSPSGSPLVTWTSSNQVLVPDLNISDQSSGATHQVTITPVADQTGVTTITAAIDDGTTVTPYSFHLYVNEAPTISDIPDQTIPWNSPTPPIPFSVGQSDSGAGAFTVTVSSSNKTLVPDASIFLNGSGKNRTLTISPTANQIGTTTITVLVSDGVRTASDQFVVDVRGPMISVEYETPSGLLSLRDGEFLDLGEYSNSSGQGSDFSKFIIRNVGFETLTGISLSPQVFNLMTLPASSLAVGESTSFVIRTTVYNGGQTLGIASNDPRYSLGGFRIRFYTRLANPVYPVVATASATSITTNGAVLNATVNPKNSPRNVQFSLASTGVQGTWLEATPSRVDGTSTYHVSAQVSGLLSHTQYFYGVLASGRLGEANGQSLSFTTLDNPPQAGTDNAVVLPGYAVTIPVLVNDTDVDGDTLTLTAIKTAPPASAGTAKIVSGSVAFTAAPTFTGTSFTYSISDGFGGTAVGTVNVGLDACALSPASNLMPATATSYPVNVTASAPWMVSEALSWATVSPMSGTGNGNVTVSLLANTSKTSRSGVITIGGRAHTITQAGTLGFTIDQPAIVPTGMVSANYSLTIPALTSPVKFTMSGHPSGLAINASTGAITGKPKASGTFKLSITGTALTGSSIAGAVTTLTVPITIQALPLGAVGTFHGPIAREADLSLGLGGRFEVTTTSTGTLTGKVVLGATSYTFPTTAVIDSTVGSASPTVAFNIPRKLPASPLAVSFTLDSANHAITGGDINDGTHHATFTAWRKKWGTTLTQPEKDDLNRYLGFHTFALKAPAGQPALPHGAGYGTFTVAATTGAITTAGKLADNTAFTSSSFCGPNGEVLMYQALYSNKGSILGTLDITQGSAGFVPPYGDNTLAGIVSWLRPAISGRVYPTGFGPYDLTAVGGRYVAPAPSTAIVMGIVDNLTSNNATLTFSGADILSSPDIAFRLAAKSVFVKPTAASNPSGTTLTITPSTGYITGSFKLTDANAFVTTAVRPATYYGQIVRDSDQVMRGYGFFLLADSPAAAGQTVNTTLQKSGIVVLEKNP